MEILLLWLQKMEVFQIIVVFFSKIIVLVDAPGETELPLEEALNDTFRVNYYSSYLDSVMKAIDEGVKVEGYFAWSLMVFLIL